MPPKGHPEHHHRAQPQYAPQGLEVVGHRLERALRQRRPAGSAVAPVIDVQDLDLLGEGRQPRHQVRVIEPESAVQRE
jgi:hypothetical protein